MKIKPIISKLSLSLFLVLFLFDGCTQRIIDFTVISSKQMNMKIDDSGKGDRVVGKDGVYWIISIPLGAPNLKEAVDRAIESAGPGYDALIDGVVYSEFWWAIITGYSGYKVEGTPIKSSKIIAELIKEGKDVNVAMKNVVYHSSLGKSNEEALHNLPVIVR
jgi:hypothetical protein